jgi:hypothetical protein
MRFFENVNCIEELKMYKLEINFKDGTKIIESFKAKNEVEAHHMAYKKYEGKYCTSIIL